MESDDDAVPSAVEFRTISVLLFCEVFGFLRPTFGSMSCCAALVPLNELRSVECNATAQSFRIDQHSAWVCMDSIQI